jgi:hypothetical protein
VQIGWCTHLNTAGRTRAPGADDSCGCLVIPETGSHKPCSLLSNPYKPTGFGRSCAIATTRFARFFAFLGVLHGNRQLFSPIRRIICSSLASQGCILDCLVGSCKGHEVGFSPCYVTGGSGFIASVRTGRNGQKKVQSEPARPSTVAMTLTLKHSTHSTASLPPECVLTILAATRCAAPTC